MQYIKSKIDIILEFIKEKKWILILGRKALKT
jgi:hypothetical protein